MKRLLSTIFLFAFIMASTFAQSPWTDNNTNISYNGKVLIGAPSTTMPGTYKLYVEDGILTENLKLAVAGTSDWSDYVFEDGYYLLPIDSVEAFIAENKHLPDMPSAEEIVKNGLDVGANHANMLRQIEELWLHLIELDKERKVLEEQLKKCKNE